MVSGLATDLSRRNIISALTMGSQFRLSISFVGFWTIIGSPVNVVYAPIF